MAKRIAKITFRTSEEIKIATAEIAQREHRSISQQVEHWVARAIARYLAEHPEVEIKNVNQVKEVIN